MLHKPTTICIVIWESPLAQDSQYDPIKSKFPPKNTYIPGVFGPIFIFMKLPAIDLSNLVEVSKLNLGL